MNSITMPILFLAHGSPMNAVESNAFTQCLSKLSTTIPIPKTILVLSAHWTTQGTWITSMKHPKTIHDFYGFPDALFNITYPAIGNPELARLIQTTLLDKNIRLDSDQWGLDHGAWSILKHIYPKADIPVIQMSLDLTQSNNFHFELGKRLHFLRSQQDVLILASGNIVHNLRQIEWKPDSTPKKLAIDFDAWFEEKLIQHDFAALTNPDLKNEMVKFSIPTWEHYLPLLYILGAVQESDTLSFIYEGFQNSSISMRSFKFS